jgi:quercetin dioxygenase-like cupin family protein
MGKVMVPYFLIVIGALVSLLVLVPAGDVNAQQNGAQVARLLKTDIDGTKWDVMTVEVARGKAGARNLHPGAELIYVLEGEGFLEVEGKSPIPLSPGTIAALGPTQRHVLKSMSQAQTLKVLVISLLGKRHPSLPSGAPSPSTGGQEDPTRRGLVF